MIWLQAFCAIALGCSVVYWLVNLTCTLLFFRRQALPRVTFSPPVSVLKPMCGYDEDLEDNLRAWCHQQYPSYQVLFGVEDESDPCVPIVRRIMAESPDKDLELVLCGVSQSANRKVHKLQVLQTKAKHDIFVLADSDVSTGCDCLQHIVAPLVDDRVGLVCCPYRWKAPLTMAAALEALTSCAEFLPSVLLVERFGGLKFALGATMVVRRHCIVGIGGLEAIQDYLADDYQLGCRIHELGFELVMSDYLIDLIHHTTPWQKMVQREIRLARTYRGCRPWGYFLSILTHGMTWATLFLWSSNCSRVAGSVFLGTLCLRLGCALVLLLSCFPDWMTTSFVWLLPIRDWLASIWWLLAYTGNKVTWRGNTYALKPDGTLTPILDSSPAGTAKAAKLEES